MLVAIDIGNSNVVFGLFQEDKLINHFRLETNKTASAEEYGRQIKEKLGEQGRVTSVIIGSVVPGLDDVFNELAQTLFTSQPLFATTELVSGISNLHPMYSELGADRLANIVAAHAKHRQNAIIVDTGTATKFDAVSEAGEYQGGAIGPGIENSFRALITDASKLQEITLHAPRYVVAKDSTADHLNSGFVYGFSSLIEGMIDRMKDELNWERPYVILTGGVSPLIQKYVRNITQTDPYLTLEGLQELYQKNS